MRLQQHRVPYIRLYVVVTSEIGVVLIKDLRYTVENLSDIVERNRELHKRLEGMTNTDSFQYDVLLDQLEENEDRLITFIEGMEYLKSSNSLKHERAVQIVQFRANGWTYEDIGKVYGITKERIRQVLNETYETMIVQE